MSRHHFYVSDACLHGLHASCDEMCSICAEPCRCTFLRCHDGASLHDAESKDYELTQRIAVGIDKTPGFFSGDASPWSIAQNVLKVIRELPPKES